ncbi:hypothetical protein C5O78_08450 [Treponema phagedenis]|nr:hypothetical protein C5O78_08450 [Treponema phagedenis]
MISSAELSGYEIFFTSFFNSFFSSVLSMLKTSFNACFNVLEMHSSNRFLPASQKDSSSDDFSFSSAKIFLRVICCFEFFF